MSKQVSYQTVGKPETAELVEKKSRFIGHIAPVQTQEEALGFVARIKADYKDASHNVHAFILRENNLKRFSDDGEPQGTAGKPILAMLEKENLVDVAVVVTRYFGGTLLGTGGLVRAYSHTAKLALEHSGIVTMCLCEEIEIQLEYPLYDIFLTQLEGYSLRTTDTVYTDKVTVTLVIDSTQLDSFQEKIVQMSKGSAKIQKRREFFSFF